MSTWRDGRLHLDEVPITDGPHHAVSPRKRRFGLLRLSRRLECANSIVFGYGLGGVGEEDMPKRQGMLQDANTVLEQLRPQTQPAPEHSLEMTDAVIPRGPKPLFSD